MRMIYNWVKKSERRDTMIHSLEYKPYVAIIGDIIKSKSIKERKNVQEKLYQVLMKLNEKYQNDIAANFIITLGDEFQGLLHEGENVLPIIEYIQMEMHPVEIRFGIGVGKLQQILSERDYT